MLVKQKNQDSRLKSVPIADSIDLKEYIAIADVVSRFTRPVTYAMI